MSFPGPDQVAGWGAPQQPPAPPRKSKTPVVVLAVLAALFAITAGIFTVLYFGEQAEVDRAASATVEKQKEVDAAKGRLADAEGEAQAATDELEGHQSRQSSLKSERDDLAACAEAAGKYIDAPSDSAAQDEWFDKMYDRCNSL